MQRVTHSIGMFGGMSAAIAAASAGYRVGMPTPEELANMAALDRRQAVYRPQPQPLKGKRRLKWLRRNPRLSRARR